MMVTCKSLPHAFARFELVIDFFVQAGHHYNNVICNTTVERVVVDAKDAKDIICSADRPLTLGTMTKEKTKICCSLESINNE